MVKRYLVFVDGQVQGVGFRGFCMLEAQRRDLTGSVKNLSNGLVQIYVQGEETRIDDFLVKVKQGDGRFIHVTDISVKQVPIVEGEKRFSYGW